MTDRISYHHLWSVCDYFLAYADQGFHLSAVDGIRGESRRAGTKETYAFEKITRKVLAAMAGEVRAFAEDAVAKEITGDIEQASKDLEQALKQEIFSRIIHALNRRLILDLVKGAENAPHSGVFLVLTSLYYAFHKNRHIKGYGISPFYFRIFLPLLAKAHDPGKIVKWETRLQDLFFAWLKTKKAFDLAVFFEDRQTRRIASQGFAGILSFLQQEEERVAYILEVVNGLSKEEVKAFTVMAANGFNATVNQTRRFRPGEDGERENLRGVPVISHKLLEEIIDRAVDQYFDPALAEIIEFCHSAAEGRPKKALAKNFDRLFITLNRTLWEETLGMVAIQRRVLFRNRHLLRSVIHYLFESRGIEREFWKKYIPSVERVLRFAFRDEQEKMWEISSHMDGILETYRQVGAFDGTDWEGFYTDDKTRKITFGVLREISVKGAAPHDRTQPSPWFAGQVGKGVDDVVLLRFFSTALEHA